MMLVTLFRILIFCVSITFLFSCNNTSTENDEEPYAEKTNHSKPQPATEQQIERGNENSYVNEHSTASTFNEILIKGNGVSDDFYLISDQIWMDRNLNLVQFRNGDPIPIISDDNEWFQAGENQQPACCYYNNDPANGNRYGVLYNWYAVNDKRGLAPKGWHIATIGEWDWVIETELDVFAKHVPTANTPASFFNQYGGLRSWQGSESFIIADDYAQWWSFTHYKGNSAYGIGKKKDKNTCEKKNFEKKNGYSVRCVKDYPVTVPDGNWLHKEYATVNINRQVWMQDNLHTLCFRNGDSLHFVDNEGAWRSALKNRIPACCFNDFAHENGEKYGIIYNWYAVSDSRGLAPDGWHVPSEAEWEKLSDYLGGKVTAGGKLKSSSGWNNYHSYSGNGTNSSGFSGIPAGGVKGHVGDYVFWWSSSISAWNGELPSIYMHYLSKANDNLYFSSGSETSGFYVRCIRDELSNDTLMVSDILDKVEPPIIVSEIVNYDSDDLEGELQKLTSQYKNTIEKIAQTEGSKKEQLKSKASQLVTEIDKLNQIIIKSKRIEDDNIYDSPDHAALFIGGSGAMNRWISENINYPEMAKENAIQGRVYVEFVVWKDGSIQDVKVVKGVHASLDREAIKTIKKMPRWSAAENLGEKVNSRIRLPINFRLN